MQGGVSSGYKNYIAEKEIVDNTYTDDGVALFRVQGYGPENMQAIQVEPVNLVELTLQLYFLRQLEFNSMLVELFSLDQWRGFVLFYFHSWWLI